MKKTNYVIFNIMAVLGYFYGVILIASVLGIPLGIYSIIAAQRYSSYSEMSDVDLAMHKTYVVNWIIFGCVLYFPLGLLGLITMKSIDNNIVVTNTNTDVADNKQETPKETVEVEINTPVSESEKLEKLEKLKRFKENGLISEEEFEQAKAELEEK